MSTTTEFDIAIVGLACRFPGAAEAAAFWRNLEQGVESIRRLSEEEVRAAGVAEELWRRPDYVRAAPVLEDPAAFDPEFFGYSEGEAAAIDPQQRLLLELAHEALEDSGIDPGRSAARTAVFAGSALNTYLLDRGAAGGLISQYIPTLVASDKDFLATRVSYKLGLRGPSVTVQSACSTALVAVHLARQSLLAEESDVAVAGAASIRFPHTAGYLYDGSGVVSREGRVKAFGADADGTVFGSGAGVVVLKRLADALASGDRIYAVLKGSAVNNDGADKAGYTAPSMRGQADAILEALGNAGLGPDDLTYIEAHGSGTPLGDRIEAAALTDAFRRFTTRRNFCALGSVKANVGHLDAAAGMAGLIKTALALQQGKIPASLHTARPNPEIDFPASPFFLATATRPWPGGTAPRRAGVLATGMGGTNSCLILEEAPAVPAPADTAPAIRLFVLSARSESALREAAARLQARAHSAHPALDASGAARTLALGRRQLPCRRAAAARSLAEAAAALCTEPIAGRLPPEGPAPAAFLLPGAGEQYPGMGLGLYRRFAVFRREIDRCAEALGNRLGCDLREILYPPIDDNAAPPDRPTVDLRRLLRRGEAGAASAERPIDRTLCCSAALFATTYAAVRLWEDCGIAPARLVGHSLGEWVAACLAGVFTLPEAIGLVAERARLAERLPAGSMTAVMLPEAELRPLLGTELALALVNGPALSVVAGPPGAMVELHDRLRAQKVLFRSVRNGHPFHTAAMTPIAAELRRAFASVRLKTPQTPFLSGLTGDWITPSEATDPDYWVRQTCGTVRFSDGLRRLWELPPHLLVEAGPGRTLGNLAMQHPARGARTPALCASIRPEYEHQDDEAVWWEAAGRLWANGAPLRLEAAVSPGARVISLPAYPFERRRCWLERPAGAASLEPATIEDGFWVPQWDRCPVPRRAVSIEAQAPLWLDWNDDFDRQIDSLRRRLPDRSWQLAVRPAGGAGSVERLAALATALGKRRRSLVTRLAIVTSGAHDVTGAEPLDPQAALASGAALVLPREYSRIEVFTVDVDEAARPSDLEAEFSVARSGDVIAWRGSRRWIRRFGRAKLPAPELGASLRRGGVCLITGGTGGIGMALARSLAAGSGARIALVARRRPDSARLAEVRRQIEAAGGEAEFWPADVTDASGLAGTVAAIRARWGAIAGVIHAAGTRRDGMIEIKQSSDIAAILAPKVTGTLNLFRALAGEAPDFFVLCSSLSSLVSYHGQADYAAANAFMDTFAAWASRSAPFVVQAIDWPVWREVGMAAGSALARSGIATSEGVEAFHRIVRSRRIQTAVSRRDPAALAAEAGSAARPPADADPVEAAPVAISPADEVEQAIAAIWRQVLGDPRLGLRDDFIAAGGHSLLAMRIVTQVRAAYDIDFTLRDFFAAPTIAGNAAAVQEAILKEIDSLEPDHA